MPRSRRGLPALLPMLLLLTLGLCVTAGARAASAPPLAAFATVTGTVQAVAVSGNTLFIGGEFTTAAGRSNLAAINLQSGAVDTNWIADTDGPVHALAVSVDGATLYLGGEFTRVRGLDRQNIAAVGTATGAVLAWNPGADGAVRALARSADRQTLYLGGDFSVAGGLARDRIASVSLAIPVGADGVAQTGGALPWHPLADAPVHVIALDEGGGRVYAGGEFTVIGGQSRTGLAALSVASAAALAWNPALQAGARVRALALHEGALYAGGLFQAGGRANLVAFDAVSAAPRAWDGGIDGEVRALALLGARPRLYAGGGFAFARDEQGALQPRARLAAFRIDAAAPALMAWSPDGDDMVAALMPRADGSMLYTGGAFTIIAGAARAGLAAFPVAVPLTVIDPPGGSMQAPTTASLSCEDRTGAGCLRICYRSDEEEGEEEEETEEEEPQVPADCTTAGDDPLTVAVADTTLRFFSEDADGNREPLRTERYAVDDVAPVTVVSLPSGLYGSDTIAAVTLTCADDHPDFPCTIYYTLDGSAPNASSLVYQAPIALAALFPDPGIPPAEVDPLLHLAGTVVLRVSAVDDAGNVETPRSSVYEIDLAPPQVVPTHPSGNYTAPQSMGLICNDGAGSGCVDMFYTLNGALPALDEAGEPLPPARRYQGSFSLDSAATVSVLAIDRAGNSAAGIVAVYAFTAPAADTRSGVGAIDGSVLIVLLAALMARRVSVRAQIGARRRR